MAGTDFGISLGAGMAKDLVWGAVRQARYCYQFNTLVTDLGEEEEELISTRESILVQVRKAKANTGEPSRNLEIQLEKANNLIEKVEKLKGKAVANKSCCGGVWPNWICRYIVGKQAARNREEMRRLKARLAQELLFAHRLSLRPMAMSKNFILFECTKKAQHELSMALKDEEIVMIGLHGMGGCGKTSLLKQVHKAVEDDEVKLFDKVVYVKLSNPPNILTIQDSIASWLGLKLTERTEPERAARLSMRLNDGGKFLIILDDVWEVLKLEDIGIPVGENCKVLISTRQQQLCNSMDCQKLIYLSLPTIEEAWDLFQKYAGVVEDRVKGVAQEIAGECGTLPIAIKAVASSLKGKPIVVWEEALKELRDGRPLVIDRGVDDPYICLKSSFDRLEDEEERSLFLLCALFSEDSEIALEILIRFAFGLGIFENVKSYVRARTKVVAAINKITDYCLLLPAEEGQHVKMHGLMRDMALSVAERNTQVIKGPRQNLEDLTEKEFMKDITRLYCHDINEFPDQLNCPKLEILFVANEGGYSFEFQLPNTFFKETIALKVLAIKNTSVWTNPLLLLPQSIEGLRKLRTLCLTGWTLGDPILGRLDGLHTIELLYCVMSEFPEELAEIGKLKLLQVSWCIIGGSPYKVLKRCLQRGLEELYFIGNDRKAKESNLEGVAGLLHQVACSTALQRYHLEIGSSKDTFMDFSTSKFISVNGFEAYDTDKAIKGLAQELEILFLQNIRGQSKNIIPDMIPAKGGCLNVLTEFLLRDSNTIECLIDTTNCQVPAVLSKLLKLKIEAVQCLEALCRGPPPSGLFEKLEELFIKECRQLKCIVSMGKLNLWSLKCLELEECSKLTSLFTTATAQTLVKLEVLSVRYCDALEHIIKDNTEDDIISLQPIFPRLKQVSVKGCEHLECIMPASFAGNLSQLESLKIEDAVELKYVFGKHNHEQNQNWNQGIDLPRLKVFNLVNLPNIVAYCLQNYQITWPSLEEPYIEACPQLNNISTNQLKDVNAVIVQVEKPEEKAMVNKSSHLGNWICQCCPAMKKKRKTKEMIDLVEKSKSIHPSDDFIFLESTKRAYDELVEILVRDDEASIIGLYGEEGCGKTSLAIEVRKAAEQYFDVVIFVAVSSCADVEEIQAKIASCLGLQLRREDESERAKCLSSRLGGEERTLIILDDVGEELSYEDIGIPYGCYVLLTTRMQQVCTLNNCQTLIPLLPLTDTEALIMFQEFAGISDTISDTCKFVLAPDILHECSGSAIAIKIVATTLKAKPLAVWMESLQKLRDSRAREFEDSMPVIYTAVKFSYDNLDSKETKSLFLFCSALPQDFEIHEEYLARYVVGLGLFGEVDSPERTRHQVSVAKNNLIDSCLLLKTNNEQGVKMNNLVRTVALRIAEANNKLIVGPEITGNKYVTMKSNRIRYLWLNKVDSFLYEVDFPELEFLFISIIGEQGTESLLTDESFEGMKMLRVLVLENDYHRFIGRPTSLSHKSLQSLTSLHFLHLRGWKFSDISFVESLTGLEILTLWYCSFHELPTGIIKLRKLRLLDLTECEIERNPYEVIVRCSQLKELYLKGNYGSGWEDDAENVMRLFANSRTTLALQRYHMGIGRASNAFHKKDFSTSRNLFVGHFDASTTNKAIKELVQRAQVLYLDATHGGCGNIIPEMVQKIGGGCMSELSKMVLSGFKGIECLIDTRQNPSKVEHVFSKLVSLHLKNTSNLETLFSGPSPPVRKMQELWNLKVLKLHACAVVEVFTPVIAESLVHLEVLKIKKCYRLGCILDVERGVSEKTNNLVFPKLKRLSVFHCLHLKYIMPASYAKGLLQLEELIIENAVSLGYVFGHSYLEDLDQNDLHVISFPAIKLLRLFSLPTITSICQQNYYPTWPSLQHITVSGCPQLNINSVNSPMRAPTISQELGLPANYCSQDEDVSQEVVKNVKGIHVEDCEIEGIFQLTGSNSFISYLRSLVLINLPSLRYICKGRIQFDCLQTVKIHNCRELKCIFSFYMVRILSSLRELEIKNCAQLKEIVEDEIYAFQRKKGPFNFCHLLRLTVESCGSLKSLFTVATARTLTCLKYLKIEDCCDLEYVIEDMGIDGNKGKEIVEDDGEDMLPKLNNVSLVKLPRLIHVYKGLKLRYEQCVVHDCPNLSQQYESPENEGIGETSGSKEEAAAEERHNDEDKAIASNFHLRKHDGDDVNLESGHFVAEVDQQTQEFDSIHNTQEGHQEQNFYPIGSENLGESDTKKAKGSVHRDLSQEEYKVATSSVELVDEHKDGREEEEQKEEVYEAPEISNVIELSTTNYMQSTEVRKEVDGNPSVCNYSLPSTEVDNQNEENQNQRSSNGIPNGFNLNMETGSNFHLQKQDDLYCKVQEVAEVDLQIQELDSVVDTQADLQEQNFYPSDINIGKRSVDKDPAPEESKMSNSSGELAEKVAQVVSVRDPKQGLQVCIPLEMRSTMVTSSIGELTSYAAVSEGMPLPQQYQSSDLHYEVEAEAKNIDQQKHEFDSIAENQKGPEAEEQNFLSVGSMNLGESEIRITKGSVDKDDGAAASQESKVATSSADSIPKIPQLQLVKYSQPPLEEYKGTPSSSSKKQYPLAEEIVDFHGLFKMNAAWACLLDEAFAKYPHLWNWHLSQKTPRLCKWGYKCLAEMLAFLKSETPKAMDDSKKKKFEDLYGELETFGFDKEWLASICRRVIEMLAHQNQKLQQLHHLNFEVSALQHKLNIATATMATLEDDLSKLDQVFGL